MSLYDLNPFNAQRPTERIHEYRFPEILAMDLDFNQWIHYVNTPEGAPFNPRFGSDNKDMAFGHGSDFTHQDVPFDMDDTTASHAIQPTFHL